MVDFNVFRDCGAANRLFQENFVDVKSPIYTTKPIFSYTAGGEFKSIDIEDFEQYEFSKSDIIELMDAEDLTDDVEEFLSQNSLTIANATKAQLIEEVELASTDTDELARAYMDHFKPKFEIITLSRYSQTHCVKVLVPQGANVTERLIEKMFSDAPIYADLTIDGNSWHIADLVDFDQYDDFSRNVFVDLYIEAITKLAEKTKEINEQQKEVAIAHIKENMIECVNLA